MARPTLPLPRLTADIYETVDGDAFVIEVPVPGLKPDQVVVDATSDSVTISTQPEQDGSASGRRYIQREQPPGPMSRVIQFPREIDTDKIEATLEHGILKVHVPKAIASGRKLVKVESTA